MRRRLHLKPTFVSEVDYEERWPETWKEELEKTLGQKLVPVTGVMDHVVQVSTEAFAGTAHAHDFALFHDGLSAWWEARAQAHMVEIGFEHRQIRNLTANFGTRYEGKIVGDSPEMCRAPDSHGFADLKAAVMAYPSLNSVYEIADSRRLKLGTPAEVNRSIERAFAVAPTSKRIFEDILALPFVLERVIEAKGAFVPDEALRHGRRLAKHSTWE